MIIIYILRIYFKKFENYDKFQNFNFKERNMGILHKVIKEKDDNDVKYIFKDSFISKNNLNDYKTISIEINKILSNEKINESILKEINQNFDSFYCLLVNKFLSFLYGNEKDKFIEKLNIIYKLTYDKINFNEEGKILYQYIMNFDLLEKKIFCKISDDSLNQEEFEILLYSFRFILNIQMNNKKCFYNNLLKSNIKQFIEENFIPGTFPFINEFIKSYHDLEEEFKRIENLGYYICKDCGFLYRVLPCTCPTSIGKCENGHIIGGLNERCSKMDIRVFPDLNSLNNGKKNDSFIVKTLEQFKTEYVDQYLLQNAKGIMKDYRNNDFERNDPVRNLHNITYRLLNFILYSNILGAFILNYLNNQEMSNFLIEFLEPYTLFGIIKKDWSILNNSLKEIGIENIQIFINIIFDKIIDLMINLESANTQDKFESFENSINNYILEIISNKDNINKLNEDYHLLNKEILSINIQSFKEIIQENYDPSYYSQKEYPDIQYYSSSNIYNLNTFIQKFNSSSKNIEKYALIHFLINKNNEKAINAINMKNLKNINKLTNLLSDIYSLKISREDAKNKLFKDEIKTIIEYYNEMNSIKIKDENQFIEDYINPFIKSWNNIKHNAVRYGCHILRDIEKGEKPLEMNIENPLNNFLVSEGDIEELFLASAYEYLIKCQNDIIDQIMLYNHTSGILNSYKPQLEQEIYIQDATDEEIINIDDNVYKILNDLVEECSMRNIFNDNDDEIIYKNYNDIKYNYDYIEEELAKYVLPGLKKFKSKIKFITFLYEGFRGENSCILIDYTNKYDQRELTNEEKKYINEFIEENNNNRKFYNDVFSSLQILMKEIINDNYKQNELVYNVIEKLSKYIKLNEELVEFLKRHKNFGAQNSFTVITLVRIFEYFEKLCWENIKKTVQLDYQLELSEEIKIHILNYFNKNEKEKLIKKKDFAMALRKFISRYLSGLRQDVDIDSNLQLRQYICREDLWDKVMIESETFIKEINEICLLGIKIGHCFNLYNLIEEEENKNDEINIKNENQINNNKEDLVINNNNLNNIIINREIDDNNNNSVDGFEEEEEERDED